MTKFDLEEQKRKLDEEEAKKQRQLSDSERAIFEETHELSKAVNDYTAKHDIPVDIGLRANVLTLQQGQRTCIITVKGNDTYDVKRGGNRVSQLSDPKELMRVLLNWLSGPPPA